VTERDQPISPMHNINGPVHISRKPVSAHVNAKHKH